VEGITPGAEGVGNLDEMKVNGQFQAVQHARTAWGTVHTELVFALEKYVESTHKTEEEEEEVTPSNVY
jgi:hypothetical protein